MTRLYAWASTLPTRGVLGMRGRGIGLPWAVAALSLGVAAMLAVAVGAAPAGNRDPERSLVPSPGPSAINYGENVGYTASLYNNQSSTFTKVLYTHTVPTTTIGGISKAATLVYASCEPGRTSWPAFAAGDSYSCPELAQLRSGAEVKVLLVWRAPGLPAQGDGISCGGTTSCALVSDGKWTIKEGTGNPGSAGPDTFSVGPVTTPLYAASADLTRARGYVLNTCSSGSSLETSVLTPVGPSNKLYTRVCASSVPGATTSPLDPGLVVEIDETATGPLTEDVKICIPVPGNTCTGMYIPWTFNPRATFAFTIDNRTLPSGEKIDKVLHDDGGGTYVNVTADCTITIVNSQKITKVTCAAAKNGSWRFG